MKNSKLAMISMNLRRFRALKGLTQAQLAKKAGISRNAYRSIEKGASEPRVSNMHNIADALGISIYDLFRRVPEVSSLRFRSKKTLSKKDKEKRQQHIVDFAYWLKDFNLLEHELDSRIDFKLAGLVGKSSEPVQMAEKARKNLRLNFKEPIIDICGLLESAGVKIFTLNSDLKEFFGFSLALRDGGPAIGVNDSQDISVERKIFTAAHELGHILLHPNSFNNQKNRENSSEEQAANAFASHFLMPQNAFARELEECKGRHWVNMILHVKRIFKVSYKTVIYRLIEMKRVDNSAWPRFYSDYSRLYNQHLKNHREPQPLPETAFREPKALDHIDFMEDRLSNLVRRAYDNEIITTNRAAEMLNMNLLEMRELAISWRTVI